LRHFNTGGFRLDDFDDLFEHGCEVFSFVAAKGSDHVFPHEIPRSNHVTCPSIPFVRLPHFFYDAYLLHKQAASRSRQTGAFPGDG
jgi:hypothetical protein